MADQLIPYVDRLESDVQTSGTTLVSCTDLAFTLAASSYYAFLFMVLFQTEGPLQGVKLALLGPANPNLLVYTIKIPTSLTSFIEQMRRAYDDPVTSQTIDSSNPGLAVIEGLVFTGVTAGDLMVRFASSNNNQATLKAGSAGNLWLW